MNTTTHDDAYDAWLTDTLSSAGKLGRKAASFLTGIALMGAVAGGFAWWLSANEPAWATSPSSSFEITVVASPTVAIIAVLFVLALAYRIGRR